MGRGRQKAKQTKVARQLKYSAPDTDLDALQRELASGNTMGFPTHAYADDDDLENEFDEDEFDDESDWTSER